MTNSNSTLSQDQIQAILQQLAGNGQAAELLRSLEGAAVNGPAVGNASSRNDTNVATVLVQYYVSIAMAADASRKDQYFVEVRPPATIDGSAVMAEQGPPFAYAVLNTIRKRALALNVVLLGATVGTPSSALLLAVAVALQTELAQRVSEPSTGGPPILEYSPNPDRESSGDTLFDIERQLMALRTPTILVFPEATREHLGWDLAAVAALAKDRSHYILASTNVASTQFRLHPDEQVFWRPVLLDGLYDRLYLARSLLEGLSTFQLRLPHILRRQFQAQDDLVPNRTIQATARELRSPANIAALLQSLANLPLGATPSEVNTCIEAARHYDLISALRQWYQGLSRREQLLAVGLCLFDRSPETQLFAALQELINDVWQFRDTLSPILDHLDLTVLRVFFQFVEVGPYSVRVEGTLSQQRHLLLQIALESHRRHLQRALPWLVDLVKQSITKGASKQELYGIDSQRTHLRATLGEAISEVSILAFDVAQPALLALVADRRDTTHVVLARALATWETRGHGERLLGALRQWLLEPQHRSLVQTMLPKSGASDESAETLLRAASLLTLTYTIRANRPGHVQANYWDLLAQLADDSSDRVVHYLRDYTLRMLLPAYISQMAPLLRLLVLRKDLQSDVCQKLVVVYNTHPHDVARMLWSWRDEGLRAKISDTPSQKPYPAEELLAAVALILSELPHGEKGGLIPLEVRRQVEKQIIDHVRHPTVRVTILTLAFKNAWRDPHTLQRFITGVQETEYGHVLQLLTEGYIEQRRTLSEYYRPDLVRPVGGQLTPLWWEEHRRPRTESEVMLSAMLIRPNDPRLRRLAFEVFMAFTDRFDTAALRELSKALQEAERERLRQHEQRMAAVQSNNAATANLQEPPNPAPAIQPLSSDFYIARLVPLLATRNNPQCREIIRELLPLALVHQERSPTLLDVRLKLWEAGDEQEVATIARCLREALALIRAPRWGIERVGIVDLTLAISELHRERRLPFEVYAAIAVCACALLVAVVVVTFIIINRF